MDIRDSLLLFIIFTATLNIPGSLCIEQCVWHSMDVDIMNDDPVTIMARYCFVNECTIRIEESQLSLNIINSTGDWILATNHTKLFTIFVNDSDTHDNCSSSSDDQTFHFDTAFYVGLILIFTVGITAAITNVSIHMLFKELRTVAGIIIIILCISLASVLIFDAINTTLLFFRISIPEVVCATYIYLSVICIHVHQGAKACILAHFVYSMYRSYKALGLLQSERRWICRYVTFIIGATAVFSGVVITLDIVINRKGFDTSGGQCISFFDTAEQEGIRLSAVNAVYFATLLTWLFLQFILVTIGTILYLLNTRQCCKASTSRDFRVSLILTITLDFNIIIFILLLVTHVSTITLTTVLSIAVGVEQVALCVFFASSSKVMCCSTKGTSSNSTSNSNLRASSNFNLRASSNFSLRTSSNSNLV